LGIEDRILQAIVAGVTIGSLYSVVGILVYVVYNVTKVFDISLGCYVMLGGMIAAKLYASGLILPLSLTLAVAITAIIGAGVWWVFMRRSMESAEHLTQVLLTVGIMIMITGLAEVVFGIEPRMLPHFADIAPIRISSHATISPQAPWLWGTLVVMIVAIHWLYNYSMLGKGLRAVRDQVLAARLMGIKPLNMMHFSYSLAALLGAIMGVVVAPMTAVSFYVSFYLVIYGLIAGIVGGITRIRGVIVAGLTLGVLEQAAAGFISSDYAEVIALSVFFVALLFRPTGLLGTKEVRAEVKV
jgi:branched-chain amino acid transport system permease protein